MMLRGASDMEGDVLVAGGGLGVYPQYLQRHTRAKRITVVERHPDVVAALRTPLEGDTALEMVQAPIEEFIAGVRGRQFDCCYIDIHPTLDPRWLPCLNQLRDRCTGIVRGPVRIWGYACMAQRLARGIQRHYLPLLRCGLRFDDQLGDALARDLPANWQQWSQAQLQAWLRAYAHSVAWPAELGNWSRSQDYRPRATPQGI